MAPTYEELQQENVLLKEQIAWLKRQLFGGGKSEKIDRQQALLALGELEERGRKVEEAQQIAYTRTKPAKASNGQADRDRFERLPVTETVEIIPEAVQASPELFEAVGAEETFEVDITPPKLVKRLIRRIKYRHLLDRSRPLAIAPAPLRPVQNSYASAGLIAWVALSKYLDHLPLYRQQKMFERWGATVSRQTMADWVQVVAFWLKPLYNHMKEELLAGTYLQADETPVRFQEPDQKKGKTSEGYLWVIHRPGLGVVFDWRLSRRHCEATDLLGGFSGLLQTDGYGAYHALARANPSITHLGCWAHARRGFFEARQDKPKETRLILGLIGRLYDLEEGYRRDGLDVQQRTARREREHPRLLKWLKIAIRIARTRCLAKDKLGKACTYAMNHWPQLCAYVHHGEAEIDNNLVENKIRPSAIGKKNWLFIGSPEAGERTAIIYSLLLTCEIHGINPHQWMREVLAKLPSTPAKADQIALLPHHWKP